jgi:hypothetical protein
MDRSADTPRQTRGSFALAEKFWPKRSGAQKDCSERTKIAQHRLSKIASSEAFPRADEGARLVEEGIPIHWWNEPPTEEQLAKAAEREQAKEPAA